LAEILGTFILVIFGLGSIAQNTFAPTKNDLLVALSFGFGGTLAGTIVSKVSGRKALLIFMFIFKYEKNIK